MKTKLATLFLFVSGAILLGIGFAILFSPAAFHASNGITLENSASLMSEVRTSGGLLFASGLVIIAAAFRHKLRSQAVILATLFYGICGLARLLSIALDGMPSSGIVGAMVIELVVAALGLLILTPKHASMKSVKLTDTAPRAVTIIQ